MRPTHTDRLLRLSAERQIVRTRDARALGIPPNYLGRLVHKRLLKKVKPTARHAVDNLPRIYSGFIQARQRFPTIVPLA
jgi:hypothetical protein